MRNPFTPALLEAELCGIGRIRQSRSAECCPINTLRVFL